MKSSTCISNGGSNCTARPRFRRRTGIAIIWVVLTILIAVGFIGLATDSGYVLLTGHQLQRAADCAALAGAAQVQFNTSTAVTDACAAAALNSAAGSSVQLSSTTDVQCGNYNTTTGTFTANATPYNAVCVTARRTSGSPGGPLNLLFGPVFGITNANVSRQSIAMAGGTLDAGVIVLSSSGSGALTVSGTSTLAVSNSGCIQCNSNSSSSVNCGGSCAVSCKELRCNGGCTGSAGTLPTNTCTNCTPCSDPCASLPVPTKGTDLGTCTFTSGSHTCNPGYYSGGITCSGTATCILNPGTYICGGAGLTCSNTCTFYADNCTFYLTTGKTTTYSTCNITTTGTCEITPPTTGSYAGNQCCIFCDRSCPSTTTHTITCCSKTNITGCVYCPSCACAVSGTGNCCGQLICNTCTCSGSGTCTVNYPSNCNPVTINNVSLCK